MRKNFLKCEKITGNNINEKRDLKGVIAKNERGQLLFAVSLYPFSFFAKTPF